MPEVSQEVSFLDRPVARLCGLGVTLLMVAALAFMHRGDLFPAADLAVPAADDPVARCLAERAGDIDRMQAEGTINAEQAELFKSRAAALCQAQLGGAGGPPPQQ